MRLFYYYKSVYVSSLRISITRVQRTETLNIEDWINLAKSYKIQQ